MLRGNEAEIMSFRKGHRSMMIDPGGIKATVLKRSAKGVASNELESVKFNLEYHGFQE